MKVKFYALDAPFVVNEFTRLAQDPDIRGMAMHFAPLVTLARRASSQRGGVGLKFYNFGRYVG